MYLTNLICTNINFSKDKYISNYEVIDSIFNKILIFVQNYLDIFLTIDDNYIRFYYLILLGFVARKTNFDEN